MSLVDIFEAVGLDKPNIGILDEAFLSEIRNLPERNLAVELLERLLAGEVKTRFATNIVQQKKFSELLTNVVQRYQNRAIETAQVIEELIAMARKFQEAVNMGESLGLNTDELAENLRKSITVDWSTRESVRARLRLLIKRILRTYKYPPTKQEEALTLVLEQAETLSAMRATRSTAPA